jgi:hypothetical protein
LERNKPSIAGMLLGLESVRKADSATILISREVMQDEFGSLMTFQKKGTDLAIKLDLEFSYSDNGVNGYQVNFTRKKILCTD